MEAPWDKSGTAPPLRPLGAPGGWPHPPRPGTSAHSAWLRTGRGSPTPPPRSKTRDSESRVDKRLRCGEPAQRGALAYRGLSGGPGPPRVALRGPASLGGRSAPVSSDHWGRQGRQRLHAGVLSRPSVLPGPARRRKTGSPPAAGGRSAFLRWGGRGVAAVCRRGSGTPLKGGDSGGLQPQGRPGPSPPHLPIIAPRGGGEPPARPWGPLASLPSPRLRPQGPGPLLPLLRQTGKAPARRRGVATG